jgi:hypothetical protein
MVAVAAALGLAVVEVDVVQSAAVAKGEQILREATGLAAVLGVLMPIRPAGSLDYGLGGRPGPDCSTP